MAKAVDAEGIANLALGHLGEDLITDLDNTGLSGVTRESYNVVIEDLIESHQWRQMRKHFALDVDAAATAAIRWQYAHRLPDPETTNRVGFPSDVFNTSAYGATPVLEWELAGEHILSNYATLWASCRVVKPVREWQASFQKLAGYALAADWAGPVTETDAVMERWTRKAWGLPSEGGRGGQFKIAMDNDRLWEPSVSIMEAHDPIAAARFGRGGYRY